MSETMWGFMFLILGLAAAALLLFFGSIATKNEQDYYALKEATQNAMLDSVDEDAYHVGLIEEEVKGNPAIHCDSGVVGTVRIITEKFVENFARRYAEAVDLDQTYNIGIYDIQECPPKVSLVAVSKQNASFLRRLFRGEEKENEDMIITNKLSAILETKD